MTCSWDFWVVDGRLNCCYFDVYTKGVKMVFWTIEIMCLICRRRRMRAEHKILTFHLWRVNRSRTHGTPPVPAEDCAQWGSSWDSASRAGRARLPAHHVNRKASVPFMQDPFCWGQFSAEQLINQLVFRHCSDPSIYIFISGVVQCS